LRDASTAAPARRAHLDPPRPRGTRLPLLEKSPERRPPSAQAVGQFLESLALPFAQTIARDVSTAPSVGAPTDPRQLTPAAVLSGGALTGPRPLDTIQLIEGHKKTRGGGIVVAIAAALVFVGALGAGGWYAVQRFGHPGPKSKDGPVAKDTAAPVAKDSAAPVAKDTAAALKTIACEGRGLACASFEPADPKRVDVDEVIAQATKLAEGTIPGVELTAININGTIDKGKLDFTKPTSSSFIYSTKDGNGGMVNLTGDGFAFIKFFSTQTPLPHTTCTFQRAWDATAAAGATFAQPINVSCGTIEGKGVGVCFFVNIHDVEHGVHIDTSTCAVWKP
jgi:hypothetical protein